MKSPYIFYLLIAFYGLGFQAITPSIASAAESILQNNSLPANGRQETLLTVPAFGRYSLISKSEQGTALRYINKMSGPSELSGAPGVNDGRIDTFLDIGEYKIVTYADDKGSGEVSLSATPFSEINADVAPQLIEHKLVSEQLGDFQQRSYWINIKKRQTVLLEAAGRSLGDLRLWHDGNWLLDLNANTQTIEPEVGKPLTVHRLSADLNPGLYLLVAYGGAAHPWAETSSEQPFHLRMGIPEIAANGIDHKVTSPFGYDRWLVPAPTDYYRLELKENAPASIDVVGFDRGYSLSNIGKRQEITKESRLPVAEVRTRKGKKSEWEVATISATAGQPYIFQRFSAVRHKVLRDPGVYWVSTLHSGYGEDSADATSVLTHFHERENYIDSRAIALDRSRGWQRRFNILNTLTLYFEVKQQGNYRIEADGIEGEYRFEPFTTYRGNNYKTPKARNLGSDWPLDPGFYILTVIPDSDARGVATLSVYPEGRKPVSDSEAHISSRYQRVNVQYNNRYKIYLNQQPGVTSGILVRKYPIDLADSMPLTLNPGERISLDVRVPARGELVVLSEDGSLQNFRLKKIGSNSFDNPKAGGKGYRINTGRYELILQNPADRGQNYQVQFTDASQLETSPLPAFDLSQVRRPNFPELSTRQAHYFDLKKKQWAAFNVAVREPGLYKIESSGLLETQGNIRTKVITQLDKRKANGVGRNFLIQQYLREGDYQLALATQGDTQGHLGVHLNRTSLIDGGRIEDGVAARYSLPSGEGLQYTFEIVETGRYQLQSFGTKGFFGARLEDGDGWPLLKPGVSSNFDLQLHAGKYRLVVLPTELPARVVTLLKRIEEETEHEGHGPFAMDLNQKSYQHTWLEPANDENRQADIWTFELPASTETSLSLSEGMEADLIALSSNRSPLKFSALKPLKETLAAGHYRIEARASRKNNRLDYKLGFDQKELLVGQTRLVTAPADIDISTGRASLVELSSFGHHDVKAELFDADNNLLGRNDDRENDWNFNIIQSLPEGRYRLQISPVGKSSAQTSIRLSEPETLAEQTLQLPAEFSLNTPLIHSYSLDLSAQSGVFAIAAESRDSVSLTLEKRDKDGNWISIANEAASEALLLVSIDNRSNEGKNYRLKIWSPEQRGAEIKVNAQILKTSPSTEASVSQGLQLDSQTLLSNKLVSSRLLIQAPGMFKASSPEQGLFWTGAKDRPLQPYNGFISSTDTVWLTSLKASQAIQANRVILNDDILQFEVGTDTPAWIDITSGSNAYDLLIAESRTGLPGVAMIDGNNIDARQMGVGFNSSMALAESTAKAGNQRIKIWNSRNDSNLLPVRLTRHQFKKPVAKKLQTGSYDETLAPRSALTFELTGKRQDIRFNLPQGVAALLQKNGKSLQGFWPDLKDQNYRVWSDADRLLLFNTRDQNRVLTIKLDAAVKLASVSPDQLFKQYFPQAGNFTLVPALGKNPRGTVEVYGDETQLLVQNRQGQVFRGQRVSLSADSIIQVSHGVGLVSIWLNNNDNYIGDIASQSKPLVARTNLKGAKQSITLERDKPGFISLQAEAPLIARFQRNGLPDKIQVFETGMNTSIFLPRGKNQLQLQSTSTQDLNSVLRMTEVIPTALQEGLGTQVGMLPGDTRVYQFELSKSQEVGIGVQASIDVAEAYLFNQQGELLGEGVSQKHALGQGTYYLQVALPAKTGSGVDIRPAIVGLESRDTGASEKTMLDYQKYSTPEAL